MINKTENFSEINKEIDGFITTVALPEGTKEDLAYIAKSFRRGTFGSCPFTAHLIKEMTVDEVARECGVSGSSAAYQLSTIKK